MFEWKEDICEEKLLKYVMNFLSYTGMNPGITNLKPLKAS